MKTNENSQTESFTANENEVFQPVEKLTENLYENYKSIVESSASDRLTMFIRITEKAPVGDLKKIAAKILAATMAAGGSTESLIVEAEKITGLDIRETWQGVYELRVVFSAIVEDKILLTENDFDRIGSSILGLLSPFMQRPELAGLLEEAVALAKNGGSASKIRALKPNGRVEKAKQERELKGVAEAACLILQEKLDVAEARIKELEALLP